MSGSVSVSVVIPTYNRRDLMQETLQSVFAQTYRDFETIVVNDGSSDGTAELLRPLHDAGRIRHIEVAENLGMGGARNRGLAEARGEFVALLDHDDLWPPDKLAWQAKLLQARPEVVLVWGDHAQLRPGGNLVPDNKHRFPSGRVYHRFRWRNWIHSPGQTLIRRDAIERVGRFDPAIRNSDDWDLYVRLARLGEFVHVPRIALHYRIHSGNESRRAVLHARNHLKAMRKHIRWNLPLMALNLHAAGAFFVPNLLAAAADAERSGDWRSAREARLFTLLFRPYLLAHPRHLRRLVRTLTKR